MIKLSIIGNGYTAQFLSKEALKKGVQVSIITRNISKPKKNIHYFNYYDYFLITFMSMIMIYITTTKSINLF